MPRDETVSRFAEKIGDVIDYFRQEYDMPLASVVGVLQCAAFDLMMEMHETPEDEKDGDDEDESNQVE